MANLSFQSKLAKAFYDYQNKAQSFQVKMFGTKIKTVLIEVKRDKYNNTQMIINSSKEIESIWDFPNNEVPMSLSSTSDSTSSSSTNVIHAYDILPITVHIPNDEIKDIKFLKGSILLYPIKLLDGNVSLSEFQITDVSAKGNPNYGILWQEFSVAPITDYSLQNSDEYQSIIDDYINTLEDF